MTKAKGAETAYETMRRWELAPGAAVELALSAEAFSAKNGSRYRRIALGWNGSREHEAAFLAGGRLAARRTVEVAPDVEVVLEASVAVGAGLLPMRGSERLAVIGFRLCEGEEAEAGWWDEGPFTRKSNYPTGFLAQGTFREYAGCGPTPGNAAFGLAVRHVEGDPACEVALRHRGVVNLGRGEVDANGDVVARVDMTLPGQSWKAGTMIVHGSVGGGSTPTLLWFTGDADGRDGAEDMGRRDAMAVRRAA